MKAAVSYPENILPITYFGQESMHIAHSGMQILVDPYLSDYVDQNCCSENVIWKRRYPAPVKAEELTEIDVVLCTHSHYDHADPITLAALAKSSSKAVFIVPAPIVDTVASYGVEKSRIIGAYAGKPLSVGALTVSPFPAAHEELSPDENGNYACLSYKLEIGGFTLFHAGDCLVYEGLIERLGKVDVMMLPVNGRSYFKRYRDDIIGNMTAYEAADLAQTVGAKLLIPMHFDLYDVNCVATSGVVDAIEATAPKLTYHIFKPGARYLFEK